MAGGGEQPGPQDLSLGWASRWVQEGLSAGKAATSQKREGAPRSRTPALLDQLLNSSANPTSGRPRGASVGLLWCPVSVHVCLRGSPSISAGLPSEETRPGLLRAATSPSPARISLGLQIFPLPSRPARERAALFLSAAWKLFRFEARSRPALPDHQASGPESLPRRRAKRNIPLPAPCAEKAAGSAVTGGGSPH